MPLNSFGERAFQARLDLAAKLGRQVSQTEIAKAIGVHQVTLGEWERGKSEPKLAVIGKLADALGVSFAWLATGEGPVNRPGTPAEMGGVELGAPGERIEDFEARTGRGGARRRRGGSSI